MGRVNVSISADYWVKDGEVLNLAGIDIKSIHTPGHTEGGMSYFVQTDTGSVLFSGDTLFAESVGRTDFPTGSMSQIVASVKQKLFALPDSTVVYPGHGEGTSIGHEKKYNSFCQ
jgi:glyoxylase-like metal-dependent hydrolase (beta-lactamase superfamily II)